MKRLHKISYPILIAVVSGGLYYRTLAPGLTWAYDGADGGDLLAAMATGGVPHPGGYPTYILFASLFAKLPFGSLAFRTNIFSCVCMVFAVLLFFKLTVLLSGDKVVASIAATVFATFPLVWSQALITEVYALQTLLTLLVLILFVPPKNILFQDFIGGLVMGLALGNHLTAIFLLPFMFLGKSRQNKTITVFSKPLIKLYSHLLIKRIAGLFVGLSVYLTIPLRAQSQAPVNWGNAVDWDGFWWLVSGEMYHGRLSNFSPEYLFAALRIWSQFLLDQMGIVGLSLGIIALVVLFRPTRLYFMTIWLFGVYSLFAIVYFSPDSYVYMIPALMSFAIWIGLGVRFALERLPTNMIFLRPALVVVTFVVVISRAILAIPEMDLSDDHTAEQYAQTVLSALPADAIVVADGDETLFSLWYFHYAIGERPDVVVVSKNLLVQPWYHEVLKNTYPGFDVVESPWPQGFAAINPERPLCLLDTDLQPRFECW